jgi:PII-like signaling protein
LGRWLREEGSVLKKGPAKKATIYVNEDAQYHLQPLYEAILQFPMHRGVGGATASQAMAGFSAHHILHTPKVEVLAERLPICAEFMETADKVEELPPTLYGMAIDGLIEVQDTKVFKIATKEKRPEPKPPHEEKRGQAKLMRIYVGEADRWESEPLYEAVAQRLRMMDIAGATVYRGILGYGAKGHTHKESFLHRSRDCPITISVVDAPGQIAAARDAVAGMIEDGPLAISEVDIIRLIHSHPLTEADDASAHSS